MLLQLRMNDTAFSRTHERVLGICNTYKVPFVLTFDGVDGEALSNQ